MREKISQNKTTLLVCAIAALSIPVTFIALGTPLTSSDSAWVGSSHSVNSYSYSMAVGLNNTVSSNYSVAFGEGIFTGQSHMTAVGKWNEDPAGILFAVGYGTGSGDRKNAFEVYDDGRVVVKAKQGNVKMGSFGLNGD